MYSLSYPALGDLGPAEPQPLLQVVEILDLYTAVHQPLQLSLVRGAKVWAFRRPSFRFEVLWADVGPGSADSCLIAMQPTGTVEAFVDRQWCDRNLSCSAIGFSFWRKCSREPSSVVSCKAYSLK